MKRIFTIFALTSIMCVFMLGGTFAAQEGNDRNSMHTDQTEFCGYWHAAPYPGSGSGTSSGFIQKSDQNRYASRYMLDPDGTFVYGCDERNGLDRMRYASGNWYIKEDQLHLKIWERIVWEGGTVVEASDPIRTAWMIENPKVRLVTYGEAEMETYDISGPYTSSDLGGMETGGYHVIIIDGQPFFGIHAPALLNGFQGMKESAEPVAGMPGVPLFEFLGDPGLTGFAMNFDTDFPVSVSVRHDGEAGGMPVTVTEPEIIREVFHALRKITVLGEWPVSGHTDDYLNYSFEMSDGKVIRGFEFQEGMLLDGWMGRYEITGFDALERALPDPGL